MLVPGTETAATFPGAVVRTDLCKGDETDLRVSFGKQGRSAFLQSRNGTTMTAPNVLNPHPPEFDRFLHASVGEDRNGYVVTVLSTLARLGFDPWKETAELVALGRDAARSRLGKLLARFPDVPTLASDHGKVAHELSQLLPEGRASGSPKRAASTVAVGRPGKNGAIWAALAIIFVLFQMFMVGGPGSGE
ncbi:MAG: hypothetical protein ACJARR_002757 [Pseudophaeobacter arcticus]|jgi:hypothetical protein